MGRAIDTDFTGPDWALDAPVFSVLSFFYAKISKKNFGGK
jgi:hypothetical protein